eukprot:7348520-Alexandrium_andersonii.AAC.1
MSASLVGSEMCIRDSQRRSTIRAGESLRHVACWRARLRAAGASPLAVSYTHLTLPTICSV